MFADKEIDIIEWFQDVKNNEIYFLPETDSAIKIFETIHNKNLWQNWTNSSGKSDPPPDFYSDKYCLMMDIMRIDDHAYKNKKGKIVNPNLKHEKELYYELLNFGFLSKIRPDAKIFINGDSGLPSFEDHNYIFYHKNFNRIVNKHIESIPLYRENHPNYKIIFMVFDESTAYFQSEKDVGKELEKGNVIIGQPHLAFFDKRFLNNVMYSEIDCFIWFTPYKKLNFVGKSFALPKVCVFDLSEKTLKLLIMKKTK